LSEHRGSSPCEATRVAKYDKRADAENLIGQAKREGLDAIPSAKFKNNYAFFQMVMLAYNLWRYYKLLAQKSLLTQRIAICSEGFTTTPFG
jgi:hypothetical protein